MSAERAAEWPSMRIGLAGAVALVVLALVNSAVSAVLEDEIPLVDRVARCLRQEKLLQVGPVSRDPIAANARRGALATRIEGNGVHIAITASEREAAAIAQRYQAVAGPLIGRLELRGVYVYLWEGLATPTQRQTVFDCRY
jgi:hypothetical protein